MWLCQDVLTIRDKTQILLSHSHDLSTGPRFRSISRLEENRETIKFNHYFIDQPSEVRWLPGFTQNCQENCAYNPSLWTSPLYQVLLKIKTKSSGIFRWSKIITDEEKMRILLRELHTDFWMCRKEWTQTNFLQAGREQDAHDIINSRQSWSISISSSAAVGWHPPHSVKCQLLLMFLGRYCRGQYRRGICNVTVQ